MFQDQLPSQRSSSISSLVHAGVLDTAEGEAFDRIAWLISEGLKAPLVLIMLLDGERYWCRSELGLSAAEVVTELKGLHEAIGGTDLFEINDALVDLSFYDSPLVARNNGVRFLAATPISDGAGFQCGVVALLDVRPRKLSQNERTMMRCFADQLENELKMLSLMQEEAELRIEVSKAFDAKSTFLSQMSHEIRTPIAGIIGATDLLLAEGNVESVELLNTVRSSASDLLQLLNETLDSAKIEAGGLRIHSEPVDLAALSDKLRNHFSPVTTSKGLDFTVTFDTEGEIPDLVFSDPMRLRQIMFNIVHNATKFTPSGRVTCDIRVQGTDQPDVCMLEIDIADSGIGMSGSALENLFEPFRQGDEGDDRMYGGTGLGMALVKQLVDRMGGELDVKSVVNSGTRIIVRLPVQPVEDAWVATRETVSVTEEPLHPVDLAGRKSLSELQVLIADDNAQNRLILDKVLTSWGCETTVVEDGELAMQQARGHAFDAIILDLHMPRRSGFEVAAAIRQWTSSTRLIACSADTTQAAYAKCQDAGFDFQIEKPFDWEKLYHALASVLSDQEIEAA